MNRRQFIKSSALTSASMAGLTNLSLLASGCIKSKQKPNILFLFAEQHHPKVLSPAGHPIVKTPNLQRLADNGVYFQNAYCPTPLCIPSRTSTLLGRFSHSTGILDNDNTKDRTGDHPNLARNLREAGYKTCHLGKTHLGTSWDESDERYDRLGFDQNLGTAGKIGAAHPNNDDPYINYLKSKGLHEKFMKDYARRNELRKKFNRYDDTTPSVLEVEDYHDQWVSQKAVDWIQDYEDDQPFYFSVNWVGPHVYRDPPGKYATLYDPEKIDERIINPMDDLTPLPIRKRREETLQQIDPKAWNKIRAAYYGQISLIDDGIGMILKTLEAKNILDNTLIVYSADHGEMLGDHGMINKTLMYESSVGVPFIVHYPKEFKSGLRPKSMANLVDLAPTFLGLTGSDPLPTMHGQSLVPVLKGSSDNIDTAFSEFKETKMIRSGEWKFVTDPSWKIDQLFNLKNDPEELSNLILENPEVANQLKRQLDNWLKST